MIDIHSHILPGVDDGAKTMDDAIEMARKASNHGIEVMFATPHYIEGAGYQGAKENKTILEELNRELRGRDVNITILSGNEVYITPDVLTLIEKGDIATLNDSKYILMEFPMLEIPLYTESIIYELRLKGFVPIIAHPERNAKIMEEPNRLYELITKGALAQLNLSSLIGKYGEKVMNTAQILLSHDMIHFVGTDTHSPLQKSLDPTRALQVMREMIEKDKLEALFYSNPTAIINNKELQIQSPKKYEVKRSFLKRLFNR